MLGDGIFTQDGASWKHSREILRPQFSRQQYQNLDVFREHTDKLIARLSGNGESVDLQPLFFRYTLDTTTAFLFGESTDTLREGKAGEGLDFAESFDVAQDYVVKRFRLLDLYWLIGGRKFRDACAKTHSFVDGIIAQRKTSRDLKEENSGRYLFFDAIAKSTSDDQALRGQLLNILLAGRDTIACLLVWTL